MRCRHDRCESIRGPQRAYRGKKAKQPQGHQGWKKDEPIMIVKRPSAQDQQRRQAQEQIEDDAARRSRRGRRRHPARQRISWDSDRLGHEQPASHQGRRQYKAKARQLPPRRRRSRQSGLAVESSGGSDLLHGTTRRIKTDADKVPGFLVGTSIPELAWKFMGTAGESRPNSVEPACRTSSRG